MDSQHLVQLSIICQLLDSGVDISNLNPYIQEYLYGMIDELNDEEEEQFNSIFYYADTFFNKLNKHGKALH
jgi:hypothetical protein